MATAANFGEMGTVHDWQAIQAVLAQKSAITTGRETRKGRQSSLDSLSSGASSSSSSPSFGGSTWSSLSALGDDDEAYSTSATSPELGPPSSLFEDHVSQAGIPGHAAQKEWQVGFWQKLGYRYVCTFGISVLEPWEVVAVHLMLVVLAFFAWYGATHLLVPRSVAAASRLRYYLVGAATTTTA